MTEITTFGPCSPFFIVADVPRSLTHYVARLGFEVRFATPEPAPFFAVVGRESAQLMLKSVGEATPPLPNHQRHDWAPWDAFIFVSDPDALGEELAGCDVALHAPLGDRDDGLRGLAVADPDGYVCFFGRPI